MATSSIFKEIRPKDKRSVQKLVSDLKHSKVSSAQPVKKSRLIRELPREQVREFSVSNEVA